MVVVDTVAGVHIDPAVVIAEGEEEEEENAELIHNCLAGIAGIVDWLAVVVVLNHAGTVVEWIVPIGVLEEAHYQRLV